MNLNTIHKNFSTKDDFTSMIKKNKPINVNMAIDILGYIIASDNEDYLSILFENIDDEKIKEMLISATSKLDDAAFKSKNTVKNIMGTGDKIMDLINSYDNSDSEEWSSESDDEYDYKVE